MSVSEIRRTI
uniref:Uncharacterized protein n=1 Tax=Arundo donax TaxID=35708 RepID=A0A0A9BFL9_ARUDO